MTCPVCGVEAPRIIDASMIQRPDTIECAEHGMFRDGVPAGKRRRCLKCGHLECPCCRESLYPRGWCDEVVHEDGDADLCCDGECTFAVVAIEETA